MADADPWRARLDAIKAEREAKALARASASSLSSSLSSSSPARSSAARGSSGGGGRGSGFGGDPSAASFGGGFGGHRADSLGAGAGAGAGEAAAAAASAGVSALSLETAAPALPPGTVEHLAGNPISLRRARVSKDRSAAPFLHSPPGDDASASAGAAAASAGGAAATAGDAATAEEAPELSAAELDRQRFAQWLRHRVCPDDGDGDGDGSSSDGGDDGRAPSAASDSLGAGDGDDSREDSRADGNGARSEGVTSGTSSGRASGGVGGSADPGSAVTYAGSCLSTIDAHDDAVNCIAALDDGTMVTGSEDTTLKVWDPRDGRLIATLAGHASGVTCVAQLASADAVASGSEGEILVWSVPRRAVTARLRGHASYVWALAMSPRHLVSCSADKTVRLWVVDASAREFGKCHDVLEEHRDSVYSVAVFPGRRAMATGSADTTVIVWRGTNSGHWQMASTLRGHTKLVYALCAVGPTYLASASDDQTVRLWDSATGTCLRRLNGHDEAVTCLAAVWGALGAPALVSGSRDGDARVWSLDGMRCDATLTGHRDEVLCVAAVASSRGAGGVVATGCEDGTVKVWGIVQAAVFT